MSPDVLDQLLTTRTRTTPPAPAVPWSAARVVGVEGGRITVSCDSRTLPALSAMPGYIPSRDDVVLVLGEAPAYIIGLLSGTGTIRLESPGDLELRATGTLRLEATGPIQILGPEVTLRTGRLSITAKSVFERLGRCYRWVRETFEVRSGRMRTIVEGQHTLTAERIFHSAEKDVKIDGQQIHLG